jgi:hypothetical protein
VADSSYGAGLAGIESSWADVQYDNLTVT